MGSEAYAFVKDLGIGNFGIAKLLQHRQTGQLVAAKYIERGPDKIDKNVEREILNHHQLSAHPNIVHFHEVLLTPTHLIIIMEFAAGGELFDRIVAAGRFSEDESRYFFQQLISGVDYCHQSGICHRDLKLENTLLDGSAVPKLKICDFGYSKSSQDSQPKSTVGTPAYIAPEVLMRKCYSGQAADVWSCGVTLYVMLCGAYPFEDSRDPRNFRKTIQIFTPNPQARITMSEIRQHPWFVKNLPQELAQPAQAAYTQSTNKPIQNMDGIRALIQAARVVPKPPMLSRLLGFPLGLGTPVGHIPHPGMPTPCTMNQCHPHPQPPCVSMQQQPQYPSMQQQSCMGTQQPPSCMVMQQPPSCMGMQQLHDAALADNVLEADQNSLPTEIMPCSEYEEAMDARRSAHEAGKGAAQFIDTECPPFFKKLASKALSVNSSNAA